MNKVTKSGTVGKPGDQGCQHPEDGILTLKGKHSHDGPKVKTGQYCANTIGALKDPIKEGAIGMNIALSTTRQHI